MTKNCSNNNQNGPNILKIVRYLAISSLASLILTTSACQTGSHEAQEPASAQKAEDQTSLSIAMSYIDGGRPDKAMHELKAIIDKNPNNYEALNLMGITQLALSNPNRAIVYLEKAWRIKASMATGVNLSSAYLEGQRYKDAEKILKLTLQMKETPPYPHRERIYHNYGLVADKTGRGVLAENMFKKAAEENPMFYMSRMQLARIYKERRKLDLSIKELEAARFACPACFDPLSSLVEFHSQKGDLLTARRLIQDYKLTEGLSPLDRRKINDLENRLSSMARRENQDDRTKSR